MARTKRVTQASGTAKPSASGSASSLPTPAGSPKDVADDYNAAAPGDSAGTSPATPTPSQPATTSKRKACEPANSTPAPAKKRSKAAPSQPIVVDSDRDEEETACDSTEDDVNNDLETPKASQLNAQSKKVAADLEYKANPKGKKKGGNLKIELGGRRGGKGGGEIGVDAEDDVFAADSGSLASESGDAVVVSLPSLEFTVENKDKWAGSYIEMAQTHLFVSRLQLVSTHEGAGAEFTNGSLTSMVPGLSILTWDCFGIEHSYITSVLQFPNQGQYVNPSIVDATQLVFKESWSSQGPPSAFLVCNKASGRPVVFASVGGIMKSFLMFGKNIGVDGRGLFTKGVTVIEHRFEYKRKSCLIATLWHGKDLNCLIEKRHITMQTMNQRNTDTDASQLRPSGGKVGKMEIMSYPSPTKKYTPKNKITLDFSDEVPIYDGRDEAFDPWNFAHCIGHLPKYPTEDGEIPEGTGALVGYTLLTSKYLSNWKLTFNLLWVVVLAD